MASRTYYKGGGAGGGVVPAAISISTTASASDHPLQAFNDAVKQLQQQQPPTPPTNNHNRHPQQQQSAMSQDKNYTGSPAAATSPSSRLSHSTSAADSSGSSAAFIYPRNNPASPQQQQQQQRQTSSPSMLNVAQAVHNNNLQYQQRHHDPEEDGMDKMEEEEEDVGYAHGTTATHTVDRGAAAAVAEGEEGEELAGGSSHPNNNNANTNNPNEPLDYCGVRLLPGVEQLDFDEGYYVGTIDENGEMAGYGKATWHTGDTYEGEWLDGMMHGKGTYTWADGDYYHGDYVKGRMEGYGEMKDTTGLYVGEWVNDMRQGYGRMVYAGGNIYEGDWLAGMCHGPGKLIEVAANVTYEGEFNRNEKEGRGVQTNADGDVYEGEFAKGKPNGRGTYLWSDGSRYIGMFKDGVKHGDGCEWLANGDWIAGLFQNGEHVDDNSTRHKAIHLSEEDEEEGNTNAGDGHGGDAGAGAVDEHGNPLPSRHNTVNGLSDTAAAAVLEPLDPEQLRRITEPARRSSVSMSLSRRTSATAAAAAAATASSTFKAAASTTTAAASVNGASAGEAASPLTMALNTPPMLLDDSELEGWTSLKTIGKGSFGAVYTALLRNGRTVCCKVIELGNVENEEEMEKLRNEIALMKRLHHPNCVQYYGSLEDKTKNTLNIFMEYVSGGTLTSFVNKFKSIPLSTLRQWAYQMVTGVKYLHDCGIVHRDIKGDNVLVSVDGIVKLADFGCSKSIDDVCSATHGCSTMVGTPYWMAPEVIKCEAGGYGMKSDIWSLGCTIVEMLTGKPPWPECNSMWAAVYKIANSTGLPTEIPADVDPELMDLLEKCFERNPKLRPTAAELLKHPFLAKAAESTSSPNASSVKSRQ